MSLIQEALKRKEGDGEAKMPAAPAGKPPRNNAWLVLIATLVMLVLLIMAGVGLLLYSFRQIALKEKPQPAPAAVPEKNRAVVKPPAPEPILPPQGLVETPVKVATTAPAVEQPAKVSSPKQSRKPAAGAVREPREMPAEKAFANVPWPSLKLGGVMQRSGMEGSAAIVNGLIIEVGTEIQGVRLHEVGMSSAYFIYEGQTQFVRVGQSTR